MTDREEQMHVFIAKIDYFDPESWPVLAAPYGGPNPESSRANISEVSATLGTDGIALLVGSLGPRTRHSHRRKLLGAVTCHRALYDTAQIVDPRHLTSAHFTRNDGAFRMPYCIPYSQLWVCPPPLIRAEVPCGDEIVDPENRRNWFIRLSNAQAEVAYEVLTNMAGPPVTIPPPNRGFICEL